jgi:hypothetical protein
MIMRCTLVLLVALFLGLNMPLRADEKEPPNVPPREGKSERLELFDGKDIADWDGHKELWSVEKGEIVGKNSKPIPVSTYLLTKKKFTDFQLVFSAKLAESEMHSGIALWGEVSPDRGDPFTYKGHLVMFPSAWGLYDLYGRNGLKVDAGPAKKVGKQHDWNDMEIFAQGNRIRLVANGVLVVDWRDPEPDRIKEGPIGLQLHSNNVPQEVRFKGLVLTTFPDDKRLEGKKVGDKVPPPAK